jgi:hypothetical protein
MNPLSNSSEPANLKNKELLEIINASIGLIDLSFDVLIELQEKKINWQDIELHFAALWENNSFIKQALSSLNLNFSKVSLAVKSQSFNETSSETYEILKTVYNYFSGLSPKDGATEKNRDFQTAKELILAYLLLNEVLLSKVVGDKENLEENIFLEIAVQKLSVEANFRVNVVVLRELIEKVGFESDKKRSIENVRNLFKEQLKPLVGLKEIPAVEKQLEFFIKGQIPAEEPKILETVPEKPKILEPVSKPRRQIKLQVHFPTAAFLKLRHFLVTGTALWYWFTIAFSLLIGLAVFLIPTDAYPLSLIRNISGLILVYWLPGFAFVKAMFPTSVPIKVESRDLETIERLALSIGVSIALTPILGLVFYYTPLGLKAPLMTLSLIALTVILATFASRRERRKKALGKNPVVTLVSEIENGSLNGS